MLERLRAVGFALLISGCAPRSTEESVATPTPVSSAASSNAPHEGASPPVAREASDADVREQRPTATTRPAPSASARSDSEQEPAPVAPRALEEPALVDDTGKPLPQTEDRPTADSLLFRAHVEALFSAIVADDPALGMRFFFPRIAYELVKDIQHPAVDWQRRLVTAFERAVHDYHRMMGKRAAGATLIGLEVPEARVQWMKPGREGNRIGYHRVLHSRLKWRDSEGREHEFDVTSLISWRGEWYVVHLHGFE